MNQKNDQCYGPPRNGISWKCLPMCKKGHGLHEAQLRNHPKIAKTLSGFGGASVLELIQDHESGTYRAVYTVRFVDAVVVLHAFQKKSKKGIQTDKKDIELVKSRLKIAGSTREWGKNKKNKRRRPEPMKSQKAMFSKLSVLINLMSYL